ncbi:MULTISPECIES: ABC transporter ATP-binding protein [unclassified Achromobacter]|uniref:ABC transporter ATP-binding protein n=1 Tax=unclassified Achromobacter TaxID=2626865 RepID=UPI000B51D29B|nr:MULTISPECIES: ABC transporter ATP-binding protein [unclassified Achromobacter]OWT71492.1 ABC transporter ATP-binding protein [Achromobacter sp. HZ34]OWT73149.1 ABC transporter ATP-binding protein [Achromobacter sp. HZ28]
MSHLILENIDFSFATARGDAGPPILAGFNLAVDPGEFVVLLGPSGCGKSTILNLVAGFERPGGGRILVHDVAVSGPAPSRGMVFQQAMLYPWLTVLENVTFGPRMQGVPAATYLPQAETLLRHMGLQNHHHAKSWELSGGMRQRVALARAWIMQPDILLMDEPFGALDAQTRSLMQELLLQAWARARTTILFVTHDVEEALLLGTRILVMSARPGRIREEIRVPFATPRDAETLATDPSYGEIKRHALHLVREEARKHLAL